MSLERRVVRGVAQHSAREHDHDRQPPSPHRHRRRRPGARPRAERDAHRTASCPKVAKTGTFRVAIARQGAEPTFALLVLERAAGCLSALLVTESGPTSVEITAVGAATLTGVLRADGRPATLDLRFTDEGVVGVMENRGRQWTVSGQRTS